VRDLIRVAKARGFDVWILSATSQFVVQAIAPDAVGVLPERVIGVRAVLAADGTTTTAFEGCDGWLDGQQEIMTYKRGKRCWLNKVALAQPPERQMSQPANVPFAAGDADTDVVFLKDATGLRLVIDRQKPEIMCNARENVDGK